MGSISGMSNAYLIESINFYKQVIITLLSTDKYSSNRFISKSVKYTVEKHWWTIHDFEAECLRRSKVK